MSAELLRLLAGSLATLAVNGCLVFAVLALVERTLWARQPARAELAWRAGICAVLLSALPLGALLASGAEAGWRLSSQLARVELPAVDRGPADSWAAHEGRRLAAADATADAAHRTTGAHPVAQPQGAVRAAAWSLPALPENRLRWLVLGWLAGAAACLAWLAVAARRLRRFRLAEAAAPELVARVSALSATLGVQGSRVCVDQQLASPVALSGGRVCLPPWALSLPPAQQQALLAHELWHLHRRDPQWRLLHRLLLAPLFFHPLAWLALRRLDALAELACDAAAARVAGSGRPLARCLAACLQAQHHRLHPAPALAVAMSRRPGAVVHRVRILLEESIRMNAALPSRRLRTSALVLAVAAALALPSLSVQPAQAGESRSRHTAIHIESNGRQSVDAVVAYDDYRLEVEMDGKVQFAADESDVVALDDGAALDIEEERDGVVRRVLFEGGDGSVQRSYEVDGDERPWNDAARAFAAQVLPEMFRATGIDAERRAARLLERGGPDALLEEIALLHGDHVRGLYLAALFAAPGLDAAQMDRALALAGEIGSDFELRRTLSAALESPALDATRQQQLLELAAGIESDFELAELLIAANPRIATETAAEAWAAGLDELGSDFERRRVLEALLTRKQDPRTLAIVLDSVAGIGSDFEARVVLVEAAPALGDEPALQTAWLAAADGIGSDFERRVALQALLEHARPDSATSLAVLDAIAGIGSDFEALQVLLSLAEVMPADAGVIRRYREIARRLGDHERGQAERALDRYAVM